MSRVLGGIVNTVGRVVQGVSGAVNSPQGRALINAVAPLAEAALTGEAEGSLMGAEDGELNQEDEQFEAARRVVQLASAAARDVATAPPGAPPQLVGELSIIRAARTSRGRCSGAPCGRSRRSRASTAGATPRSGRGYRYGRPYGGRYRLPSYGPRYGYWLPPARLPGVLRLSGSRPAAGSPARAVAGAAAHAARSAAARLPLGRGADRRAAAAARAAAGAAASAGPARRRCRRPAGGTRGPGAERVRLAPAAPPRALRALRALPRRRLRPVRRRRRLRRRLAVAAATRTTTSSATEPP